MAKKPASSPEELRQEALSTALTTIERNTLVRVAAVRSHALVQQQKVREVNDLAREAMTDHALLANRATVLAGEDPFLADELKFYRDIARIGTGELIADLVSDYCQEGR